MIGKIFVTSSGFDPEKGKDVKIPIWERTRPWGRAARTFERGFRRATTSSWFRGRFGTPTSS